MDERGPIQADLLGGPISNELHSIFFGIFPNDDTRAAIDEASTALESTHRPSGRRIKDHRYHATLHFVGEFRLRPDDVIERLKRAGDQVRVNAFDLQLDIAGSFPNGEKPWWVGTAAVPENLTALHEAIVTGDYRSRGMRAPKSNFVPHVTLFSRNQRDLEKVPIAPIQWRVDEFCLIDSRLDGKARYDIVKTWKLPER